MCICAYVHMCICAYVHMCMHIHMSVYTCRRRAETEIGAVQAHAYAYVRRHGCRAHGKEAWRGGAVHVERRHLIAHTHPTHPSHTAPQTLIQAPMQSIMPPQISHQRMSCRRHQAQFKIRLRSGWSPRRAVMSHVGHLPWLACGQRSPCTVHRRPLGDSQACSARSLHAWVRTGDQGSSMC